MSMSSSAGSNKPTHSETGEKTVELEPKWVRIKSGVKINVNATEWRGILKSIKFQRGVYAMVGVNGVTCKGKIPEIQIGGHYVFEGVFEENKDYNTWDFVFTKHSFTIEAGAGLREYLSREAPNVGPGIAAKIVNALGDDAIACIAESDRVLQSIPGLDLSARVAIHEWAKRELRSRGFKERLYGIGLQPGVVAKLVGEFGADAERKIRDNCFALTGIHGIGWRTVAQIADLLGIPADDLGRLRAAISHALESLSNNDGSTCIPDSVLIREAAVLTGISSDKLLSCLDGMLTEGIIMSDKTSFKEYAEKIGRAF